MAGQTRLEYTDPDTPITLREGIAELRRAEGADQDAVENISPELLREIEVHDAIHVVFGCSTDLEGEIQAHAWTLLGTTVSLREMGRVNVHRDHRQVLKEIGHLKLLGVWCRNLPRLVALAWFALRMKRRWPADSFEEFLDLPLHELRQLFGVRIPNGGSGPQRSGRGGAALRHVRVRN